MSKLLIDDYPIQVLPKLAEEIGLNEAIMLQQVHYWLNNSKHEKDGKKWIYNTYGDWQKQLSFWSEKTIQRTINKLEENDLLITSNYNKYKFDKTKWYTINYKTLDKIVSNRTGQYDQTSGSSCPKEQDNVANYEQDNMTCSEQDNMTRPIPETTETTPETTTETTRNQIKNDLWESDFEKWWNLYGKKVDKKKVKSIFKRCHKKDGYEAIEKGTLIYLKTVTDKQYQKNPQTFLNAESYNDVEGYEEIAKNKASTGYKQQGKNNYDGWGLNKDLLREREEQRQKDMMDGKLPF